MNTTVPPQQLSNAETRWENEGGASYADRPAPQRREQMEPSPKRAQWTERRAARRLVITALLVIFAVLMLVLMAGTWAGALSGIDRLTGYAIPALMVVLGGAVLLWAWLRRVKTADQG